MLKYNKEES